MYNYIDISICLPIPASGLEHHPRFSLMVNFWLVNRGTPIQRRTQMQYGAHPGTSTTTVFSSIIFEALCVDYIFLSKWCNGMAGFVSKCLLQRSKIYKKKSTPF